jgi:methylmalonyl-CoA mutase
MFAGEGDPARTNRRFKLLSANSDAKRLSTAFDSVTLYGYDPDRRPDIYGKVGTSGVSVCTLDDVKVLYGGFELCAPTHVGLHDHQRTGPHHAGHVSQHGHRSAGGSNIQGGKGQAAPAEEYDKIRPGAGQRARHGAGRHPQGGPGPEHLHLLHRFRPQDDGRHPGLFHRKQRAQLLFGIHLRLPHRRGRRQPDLQLAFTLANGFTYLEYYLSRGMPLDSFGPNLSFFFSNGMDPEYTVIGRVARRIWSVALREKYGASTRSQMLKYHIQTSGRSACTARTSSSTTSAPPCRPCAPSTTTARACTPTPSTRPSPRPPRNRCAGPWPSS